MVRLNSQSLVFPLRAASATASSVKVQDASIALNRGTDVTVVVRDADHTALEGIPVTLSATGDGNSITPASATTNKKGEATFRLDSSVAGTKTITATAAGVTLAEQPTITVQPEPTQ